MVRQGLIWLVLAALVGCTSWRAAVPPTESTPTPESAPMHDMAPPPAPREFRAAWVASVANIDWPSRAGLTTAQQQEEIVRIVERAQSLRLNALIVQVRPAADALYASAFEPWSEYLTGEQGKAPEPFYDPLAFWIAEAHRRGIELHAWFNPYRARHSSARSRLAAGHVANTAPAIVKAYGEFLWLDPGEAEASRRTLQAIVDVARRYDIDGVHIDDYFYPYPVVAPDGTRDLDFPDEPSWQRYVNAGGTLARDAWRRRNVDDLVERINIEVHREKPWVRFGVSPFGLGRPDRRPPGVAGFSQYDKLHADVERWLAQGWLDYLAPQLYWPIDAPAQPFGVLLDYWRAHGARPRSLTRSHSRVRMAPRDTSISAWRRSCRIAKASPISCGRRMRLPRSCRRRRGSPMPHLPLRGCKRSGHVMATSGRFPSRPPRACRPSMRASQEGRWMPWWSPR